MECKRCGNKDPSYFYLGHSGYYCRKCIRFSRILLEEELEPLDYQIGEDVEEYTFDFNLSDKQILASKQCLEYIKDGDVLLHCVCGAGKTEIVVETIADYLSRSLKVAYAISRKEVVLELSKRFVKIFKNANVVGVYGGHHEKIIGDLIVCTCHQLYRYYQSFDLLVLDEVDAYPLKGNQTLMNICINSCKGKIIFSTATINQDLKEVLKNRKYKEVVLYSRPSGRPLIVPKVVYLNQILSLFYLYKLLHSMTNQCIVFVTNKKQARVMYKIFSHLLSCTYTYSDLNKRNKNIEDFRNKKYKIIFSTTVLERGVTIKDVSVIVYDYDFYFDSGSLVQMLGRVQRGNSIIGDAYIISNKRDKNISEAMAYLAQANATL